MTPCITTYTGRLVNPLELRVEDVCIEDVAHSLACINRFVGHTKQPISVAQHAYYVSLLCGAHAKQGLHHDDSEAYLGDVSKWVKESPAMAPYREAETRAQHVCYRAFGCDLEDAGEVQWADRLMVRFEATWGYDGKWNINNAAYRPFTSIEHERLKQWVGDWEPWDWRRAEREFLQRHEELNHA